MFLHSFYATQINAAPNLQRAALNNLFLIYYSSIKLSSPSEDELPPDEELPLDEPESDDVKGTERSVYKALCLNIG